MIPNDPVPNRCFPEHMIEFSDSAARFGRGLAACGIRDNEARPAWTMPFETAPEFVS